MTYFLDCDDLDFELKTLPTDLFNQIERATVVHFLDSREIDEEDVSSEFWTYSLLIFIDAEASPTVALKSLSGAAGLLQAIHDSCPETKITLSNAESEVSLPNGKRTAMCMELMALNLKMTRAEWFDFENLIGTVRNIMDEKRAS